MLDLFKIIILILQTSMYLALFLALPLLVTIRLVSVVTNNKGLKVSLLTIFIPFSIGYFIYYGEDNKLLNIYKKVLIIFLVLSTLGMIYTLYLTYL